MIIEFAAERRLIEFRPESKQEAVVLSDFPGFIRPRGSNKFYIPNNIPVIQNIIHRLKKRYKKPISCPKEIAQAMGHKMKLKPLPEGYQFHTEPLPHQLIALQYLYTFGGGGLLLDPGMGKTKVILDYINLMKFSKSLVVCPLSLLFVWEDEALTHTPNLKIHIIESTSWLEQLESAKRAYAKWSDELELGEGVLSAKELTRIKSNLNNARRRIERIPEKMQRDIEGCQNADVIVVNYDKVANGLGFLMKTLGIKFDFITLDEALIKDHRSKRTQAVTKLGATIPYKCIMSGTLINNSPMDAFAPIRFLNPALVGSSYSRFESYYGHMVKVRNTNRKFLAGVSKANVAEIREILESCCIVMDKNVWLKDLPPKKFIVHNVPMTFEQSRVMDELVANYITDVDGVTVEASSPLTVMAKLYQIANGFLYHYPDKADDNDMYNMLTLGEIDGYRDAEQISEIFYDDTYFEACSTQSSPRTPVSLFEHINGRREGEDTQHHSLNHTNEYRGDTSYGKDNTDERAGGSRASRIFSKKPSTDTCPSTEGGILLSNGHSGYVHPSELDGVDVPAVRAIKHNQCSDLSSTRSNPEDSRGTLPESPEPRQDKHVYYKADGLGNGDLTLCSHRDESLSNTERDDFPMEPSSPTNGFVEGSHTSSSHSRGKENGAGAQLTGLQGHNEYSGMGNEGRDIEGISLLSDVDIYRHHSNEKPFSRSDSDTGENPVASRMESRRGQEHIPLLKECLGTLNSGNEFSVRAGDTPVVREVIRFDSDDPSTDGSEKSRYLRRLLDETLYGRKVLIWYNLTEELTGILIALRSAGYTEEEISVVKGGTKNVGDIVRNFNRNPQARIIVCQAQSVNYGITVLGADAEKLEQSGVEVLPDFDTDVYTHVFYSIGFSLERFLQQQDRSHRLGLKRSPEYHILLSDCEFERYIYQLIETKVDIRESVLVDAFARLKAMAS